jgi:hypothetical protein
MCGCSVSEAVLRRARSSRAGGPWWNNDEDPRSQTASSALVWYAVSNGRAVRTNTGQTGSAPCDYGLTNDWTSAKHRRGSQHRCHGYQPTGPINMGYQSRENYSGDSRCRIPPGEGRGGRTRNTAPLVHHRGSGRKAAAKFRDGRQAVDGVCGAVAPFAA